MKKLSKRVTAGGLWFDVPVNINYVAFSHTGDVYCYLREPPKPVADWKKSMFLPCGMVSLEGTDWRECCWYVGDQVNGEAAERREWMAHSFSEGYDLGHSRGLNCGRLYKSDDGMRGHRHACLIDHLGYNSGEVDQ